MTAQDQKRMASIVRAIRAGKWTDELPEWANSALQNEADGDADTLRAVQTAEAFMLLLLIEHPGYQQAAFLKACGLDR